MPAVRPGDFSKILAFLLTGLFAFTGHLVTAETTGMGAGEATDTIVVFGTAGASTISDSMCFTTIRFRDTPPVKMMGVFKPSPLNSVSTIFLARPWQSPSHISGNV